MLNVLFIRELKSFSFVNEKLMILSPNTLSTLTRFVKKPKKSDINLNSIQVKRLEIVPSKEQRKEWKNIYMGAVALLIFIITFAVLFWWVRIRTPNFSSNLNIEVDQSVLDSLREKEILEEKKVELSQIIVNDSVDSLNVRQDPSYDSVVIGQISSGEEYILLEEDGEWYKIQLDEENVGWIVAEYAEVQ